MNVRLINLIDSDVCAKLRHQKASLSVGPMLKRWINNFVELRAIYHLEKLRLKRKKMPNVMTNIVKLQPENPFAWFSAVQDAVDCLKRGGIIAVPTDTLYGLCTLVEHADRLYRLKKRPSEKPLGLFIKDHEDIASYAELTVPNGLLKNLFPGPVTVLFNRAGKLPDEFNPGVPSVSFRLPQARFVGDLCRFMPFQLIAQTSANLSGSDKNPICIEDFKDLWDDIDMIIDGGPILENNGSRLGSTIIDLSVPGQFKLLRAGCAELETTEILREYGLKSQEEVQRERLEAAAEERRKRLEGEVPTERLAAQ